MTNKIYCKDYWYQRVGTRLQSIYGKKMTNKIYCKDYWYQRDIVLGFSRQNKGLIAIGEVISKNSERFIHIKLKDLKKVIKMAEEYQNLCKMCNKEKAVYGRYCYKCYGGD